MPPSATTSTLVRASRSLFSSFNVGRLSVIDHLLLRDSLQPLLRLFYFLFGNFL